MERVPDKTEEGGSTANTNADIALGRRTDDTADTDEEKDTDDGTSTS